MDLMPEVGEADAFLHFDGNDLHEHTEMLAQHMRRCGQALVARWDELTTLELHISRREAQLKLCFELHNNDPEHSKYTQLLLTDKKITVAGQEARLALDEVIV